jgi:hypothetical protein
MQSGIYHVKFTSSQQAYGEGLAVFKDGSVNGGDVGYVYLGTYEGIPGGVAAKLKIKKWNQGITSVFGNISEFDLDLRGTFSPDFSSFSVGGGIPLMPGSTITITGKRLADAV